MTLLRLKRRLIQAWRLAYWARSDREVNRCYFHLYRAMRAPNTLVSNTAKNTNDSPSQ